MKLTYPSEILNFRFLNTPEAAAFTIPWYLEVWKILNHLMYRVPHQYGNTFNLIFSFCISATAEVKPLLESLDPNLQGATLIFKKLNYFLGSVKTKQNGFFSKCPKSLFLRVMCPGTWIWRKNKIPCMKKKQDSMYPGTWIWANKILGHFEKRGWHGTKIHLS